MVDCLPSPVDVVIAGAGPVGLFLACELRLAGVSTLVLEQAETPCSPLKAPPFGLRGLWTPTLEAFDRRDLLGELAQPPGQEPARRLAGHFAGIPFEEADIDTSKWTYRLPSPAEANQAVAMMRVEAALAARAIALGAEIKRGRGVEGFDELDDGLAVHAGGETFRAHWLVGCDGSRSLVRKAAGFEFVGTEPEFTGYSVLVGVADPQKLRLGRNYTPSGMYFQARPGTIAMAEFDGGAFHRTEPVTLDHVQSVLRRISGTDVTLTALHLATTWTDRAYQATTYRHRRVLLAGDAAHIHSPLGGQGLNLGLGDAMNLGWKLAAAVRGEASAGLIDTYTSERHPIGAKVLDWSRAQVALMRPSPSSRALEAIMRDLIGTRDGATYFAERVSACSLRYDLGEPHPLVGRSAPDFALAEGTRLGVLLRTGKGLLLDLDARAPLRALAGRWGNRIAYVAGDAKEALGLSALLVRPDGVVAWAAEGDPDCGEAARAASRWFGRPSP